MKRMYVAAMVQPRMRPDEGNFNLNLELAPYVYRHLYVSSDVDMSNSAAI